NTGKERSSGRDGSELLVLEDEEFSENAEQNTMQSWKEEHSVGLDTLEKHPNSVRRLEAKEQSYEDVFKPSLRERLNPETRDAGERKEHGMKDKVMGFTTRKDLRRKRKITYKGDKSLVLDSDNEERPIRFAYRDSSMSMHTFARGTAHQEVDKNLAEQSSTLPQLSEDGEKSAENASEGENID
ncbi:hypothetical protein HDU96_006031, partial [Phlyctochytrium bullatum]